MSKTREAFVIVTHTMCEGSRPVGFDEHGNIIIYNTKREAQLDIIDSIEQHIQQFKDGEREYEDIVFDEDWVEEVDVYEDGSFESASTGTWNKKGERLGS